MSDHWTKLCKGNVCVDWFGWTMATKFCHNVNSSPATILLEVLAKVLIWGWDKNINKNMLKGNFLQMIYSVNKRSQRLHQKTPRTETFSAQ